MFNDNRFDPAKPPSSTDPLLPDPPKPTRIAGGAPAAQRTAGKLAVTHLTSQGAPLCLGGDNVVAIGGSGEDEPMKKALKGASAAAVIALVAVCIPPAQAHADDPCADITVPTAHQACIDNSHRGNAVRRYPLGDCEGASPIDGQVGQVCG
ncbi:hypothetical protein [Mycobacterium paraense]|uniref:hypothetical protein n=1 Tax=Mycobacterium paraense TaxID=767916 RepID=UPI00111C1A1F|nr:hypothetical protein [Mycobacterium paraense]